MQHYSKTASLKLFSGASDQKIMQITPFPPEAKTFNRPLLLVKFRKRIGGRKVVGPSWFKLSDFETFPSNFSRVGTP